MRYFLAGIIVAILVQAVVVRLTKDDPEPAFISSAISGEELTAEERRIFSQWFDKHRNNPHHGPSCRATCRILNSGSCGSGTIVGHTDDGYSLVLTNAHVAGTRIGHVVTIEVGSTGAKLKGRVIMAAYSDKMLADWAILKTTTKYTTVKPVPLNCNRPTGSHYTKGYPRCKPMQAGNVEMVDLSKTSALAKWLPNSIPGQSGSGIFNDETGYVEALLTWTWSGYGAGQMTAVMYEQALGRTNKGPLRIRGLIEVEDDADLPSGTGPIVENGFFAESNITNLPIWVNEPAVEENKDGI